MRQNKKRRALSFLLIIYTLFSSLSLYALASAKEEEAIAVPALSEDVEVGSRFYELFFGKSEKAVARCL